MRLLVLLIIACAPIASFAQNKPDTIPYGSSQSDVYDMLKDGYLQFNDKPGLGITLNEPLIKKKYMLPDETWWD